MIDLRIGPLVRAVTETSITIWCELSQRCTIVLTVYQEETGATRSIRVPTILVGGRHYTTVQMEGLQSASWYRYELSCVEDELVSKQPGLLQYFRTLNTVSPTLSRPSPLRIAYGSCRKGNQPQTDALNALGEWLENHFEQREEQWPHLLLLIGDQIYADSPPAQLNQTYPNLQQGASSFEDFARIYEYTWTSQRGLRQVFATLPLFMIFDDHEITNDWNISPTWRLQMTQTGKESLIVDGLVAYWVYQGWGNLSGQEQTNHPLLTIMQKGRVSGNDILDELRTALRAAVLGEYEISWHYQIATSPSLFVTNTRADRSQSFKSDATEVYAPGRIMGREQMRALQDWLLTEAHRPAILVSSVPLLLPPLIGFIEYLMGTRLWQQSGGLLHALGTQLARLQQYLALSTSFDHWPVYNATWSEFMTSFAQREADLFILSGDVHFSYIAQGTLRANSARSSPHIYQLVSTPFENKLDQSNRQKIQWQSVISKASYGGLNTQMLPLVAQQTNVDMQRNIIYEDVLAFIQIQTLDEKNYQLEQSYLSVVNSQLTPIVSTKLP